MINDLLGLPSGQIINVTKREMGVLINLGFIQWDNNYDYFIFKDAYLNEIRRFTRRFYTDEEVITGTGRSGVVDGVISNYKGGKVNGKDVSKIFNIGDVLYIIKFENNGVGVYTENQLEKVRDINENNSYEDASFDMIGLPSGQIIEVTDVEVHYLKGNKLVKWNGSRTGVDDFIGYTFDDDDYEKVMDTLYELF